MQHKHSTGASECTAQHDILMSRHQHRPTTYIWKKHSIRCDRKWMQAQRNIIAILNFFVFHVFPMKKKDLQNHSNLFTLVAFAHPWPQSRVQIHILIFNRYSCLAHWPWRIIIFDLLPIWSTTLHFRSAATLAIYNKLACGDESVMWQSKSLTNIVWCVRHSTHSSTSMSVGVFYAAENIVRRGLLGSDQQCDVLIETL